MFIVVVAAATIVAIAVVVVVVVAVVVAFVVFLRASREISATGLVFAGVSTHRAIFYAHWRLFISRSSFCPRCTLLGERWG